jgi:hypothetical protein
MGEGLTGATGGDGRRLTVPEAAEALGVTVDAVRGRIRRGKLRAEHHEGAVYVWINASEGGTGRGPSATSHGPSADQSERVEDLREQVTYLREQLDREREARTEERRRHDTIIAQLSAANAEQARTIRAIEAPASEAPVEDAEMAAAEPEEASPRSAAGGTRETAQRPWWRRLFGG